MYRALQVVTAVLLSLGLSHVWAGSHSISIKSGDYELSTTRQVVLGRTLDFKANDTGYLSVEYQYIFDNNFSIGGEYIGVEHEYTDAGNGLKGDMFSTFALFNAKYHVDISDWIRPYLGVSIGGVYTEIEGTVNGDATGTATGYNAGIAFIFARHIGISVNYHQLDAEPEDSAGNKLDLSGESLTANLLLIF